LQDKVATSVPRYITRDRRHGDRYWRWMGLGVIAFIAISLVLWWQNYNSNIKTLNTSVNTTLSQVSTLQKTLQAENTAAQTPATPTPDQVGGALGASADLLNSTTTANPSTPAQNTTAMPATPATVIPANNANAATTPTTTVPADNATASPAPGAAANSTATTNTTTPAFKPKRKHQSDLSGAHDPVVGGPAPRLGEN
jgi:cytoskeletal protein RodZ